MSHQVQLLPVASLKPDPEQPRKVYDETELEELAANIKVHGVINAIEATSEGVIVSGERRWRASRIAGLKQVPVRVVDAKHKLVRQLSENVLREDMNQADIARALHKVMKETGISQNKLSKMLGKSHVYVSTAVSLLQDSPELVALVEQGKQSARTLYRIRAVENPAHKKFMQEQVLQADNRVSPVVADTVAKYLRGGGDYQTAKNVIHTKMTDVDAIRVLSSGAVKLRRSDVDALTPGTRLARAANEVALILSQAQKGKVHILPMQMGRVFVALTSAQRQIDAIAKASTTQYKQILEKSKAKFIEKL